MGHIAFWRPDLGLMNRNVCFLRHKSSAMELFILVIVGLLACGRTAAEETTDCPTSCSCTEEGFGPYQARCSKLDLEQKFGSRISRVIIENDNNLVLDKDTFETVGLQSVQTIRIANCTIKKLDSRAFAGLKKLRTIEISSNKQLILDPDMFNTTNIIQLVLRNNKLTFSRKANYFFDIPDLRELEISGADLTELPEAAFSKMDKLQYISLASNKIKDLGKEFIDLNDLEEVDLSNNLIGEIGDDVFNNKDLDVLKLRNNRLKSMADVQLPLLTELDVSFCKFSRIDNTSFSGLSSIRILNLSGNAISEIPGNAFSSPNMSRLTHLDLSHNALQEPLPEDLLHKLSGLEILILAHNPHLKTLPKNFFQELFDIFKLDLSDCGLETIDEVLFKDLVKLSFFNLSGNALQRLKPGVLNKYITTLDLSHNKIEYIDDVKFPSDSRLRRLILANNKLIDLSTHSLADMSNLAKLDLSSCSLSSLWNTENEPPALSKIETLSIAKNSIQSISEKQLALTPNLIDIDVSDNPLTCDDTFISSIKWFRDNHVIPFISKGNSPLSRLRASHYPDSELISPSGWGDVEERVCGDRDREEVQPVPSEKTTDEDYINEDDEDEDEEEEEEEDNYSDETDPANNDGGDLLKGNIDNIVWRPSVSESESNDNYLWSVLIVLFSAVAILFSLTVLAAFVLRWSRQRNSYGARMINTHLHPPKMKRDRSSIYQQLYEDPNHPTTPVMPAKNANQTQYNFPDAQGGKQFGYITYLSKDFKDSTVIPEPV